ncbi:MAG: AAA family ATPase [Myxococcota bacterium]
MFDVLSAVRRLTVSRAPVWEAFSWETLGFRREALQMIRLEMDSPHGRLVYELQVAQEGRTLVHRESLTGPAGPVVTAAPGQATVRRGGREEHYPGLNRDFSVLAVLERREEGASDEVDWFLDFVDGLWVVRPKPELMEGAGRHNGDFSDDIGRDFPSWCRTLVLTNSIDAESVARLAAVIPGFEHLVVSGGGRTQVLVVSFRVGDRRWELEFDLLSDGQKVLVLLYVLLGAMPGSAKLLALDEPDNWLSLREIQPFLVELGSAAADAGVQTVIASHNPEVIDFLGPRHAVILDREDGGATTVSAARADPDLRLSELLARGWDAAD